MALQRQLPERSHTRRYRVFDAIVDVLNEEIIEEFSKIAFNGIAERVPDKPASTSGPDHRALILAQRRQRAEQAALAVRHMSDSDNTIREPRDSPFSIDPEEGDSLTSRGSDRHLSPPNDAYSLNPVSQRVTRFSNPEEPDDATSYGSDRDASPPAGPSSQYAAVPAASQRVIPLFKPTTSKLATAPIADAIAVALPPLPLPPLAAVTDVAAITDVTAVANVAAVADIHCCHRRSLPSPMLIAVTDAHCRRRCSLPMLTAITNVAAVADAHCHHKCCCRCRHSLPSPTLTAVANAYCRRRCSLPTLTAVTNVAAVADVHRCSLPTLLTITDHCRR
ncbi:hypothetical protein BGW80DRAFT_1464459 [Lactifluus volemus]|nr:hypothetical protein BGW80DRAFT_1464459 [Lactifluus volemus]